MQRNKAANAENRIDAKYRLYRVIAGEDGEEGRAEAYLGKKSILSVRAFTVDQAITAAREKLDERIAALREQRTSDVPSPAEFEEAFQAIMGQLNSGITLILAMHATFPDREARVADLARRANTETGMLLQQYIWLGKRVGRLLDFAPTQKGLDRASLPLCVLTEVKLAPELPDCRTAGSFCTGKSKMPCRYCGKPFPPPSPERLIMGVPK